MKLKKIFFNNSFKNTSYILKSDLSNEVIVIDVPEDPFPIINEIQKHDVLLIHLEANLPNHAAVYLGDQQILHHVQGRLSSRDILGEYYIKNTAFVARHNTL